MGELPRHVTETAQTTTRSGNGSDHAAVQLVGLRKTFTSGDQSVHAVDGVDLTIAKGEFFSLLGPSGSGKTTVLRMIAGFETPTAGAILLEGKDVTSSPPYDRDVNTVFQDYALFPHMTVLENVEYGLKVKGVSRSARRQRALEMLEKVHLRDFGRRKPHQLSGGQRQRVALARALVNQPKVLLLDEPLGALDLKLREEMQIKLKQLQQDVGITFIFVTHDQGEALAMSDRIAVFDRGRLEQVGSPREIYEQPATAFTAGFVGTSNILSPEFSERVLGVRSIHSVRPERVRIARDTPASDEVSVEAVVEDIQYLGAQCRIRSAVDEEHQVLASVPSDDLDGIAIGDHIRLAWPRVAAFTVVHTNQQQGGNT
jgi:putative spermidine/putrescine transport system ATP-binding protein